MKRGTAMQEDIFRDLGSIGIVPVVVLDEARHAVPLARALAKGGIPAAEVTFRTDAAAESIAAIAREVPEVLVGAGTVTSTAMAQQAAAAGARYIVSPGLNPAVVQWCLAHDVPVLPGVATPTEVEAGMALGLSVLKFFPAAQNGGVPMLKALASPYRGVKFVPTGGVGPANLTEYLALPNVTACGGSWICPPALVRAEQWDEIERLCREAVLTMHGFSLHHLEFCAPDAAQASRSCAAFADLFGFAAGQRSDAFFAGDSLAFCAPSAAAAQDGSQTQGRIVISANSVERAMAWLARKGVAFRTESTVRDAKGIASVQLAQTVGGFGIALCRA